MSRSVTSVRNACLSLVLATLALGGQARAFDIVVADPQASAIIASRRMLAGEDMDASGTTVVTRYFYRLTAVLGYGEPDPQGNRVYALSFEDDPSITEETPAGLRSRWRDYQDQVDREMEAIESDLDDLAELVEFLESRGLDASAALESYEERMHAWEAWAREYEEAERQIQALSGGAAAPGSAAGQPGGAAGGTGSGHEPSDEPISDPPAGEEVGPRDFLDMIVPGLPQTGTPMVGGLTDGLTGGSVGSEFPY